MRKINIFGYQADDGTIFEIEETLLKLARNRKSIGASLNASTIVLAEKDEKLKAAILEADFLGIDGQSIVFASRVLTGISIRRSPGIDIMERLVSRSISEGLKVYLLGAEQETLDTVEKIFSERGVHIVGTRNGYWAREDEAQVVNEISTSRPDILFLAFPSPAKEIFASKYRDSLNAGLIFCVGGSFDVVAGKVRRAPVFMQKLGLEWFFRWIQEPVRLFRRYFFGNLSFLRLVVKKKIRNET